MLYFIYSDFVLTSMITPPPPQVISLPHFNPTNTVGGTMKITNKSIPASSTVALFAWLGLISVLNAKPILKSCLFYIGYCVRIDKELLNSSSKTVCTFKLI